MKNLIACFIPYVEGEEVKKSVEKIKENPLVGKVIEIESIKSSDAIKRIAQEASLPYTLLITKESPVELGYFALERMVKIAQESQSVMLYADHHKIIGGVRKESPLIEYQMGSLRDDFDFGSLLLYRSDALKEAANALNGDWKYGALYALRLKLSQLGNFTHVNEYLYTEIEHDNRRSGEKIFDYVDPKNREVQLEMERVVTQYLKEVGGYLEPNFKEIDFNQEQFELEASVIIPVYNRVKTIEEAIKSVLIQESSFNFNLIIVDNHSTDGTSEIIRSYSDDPRVLHLIPERRDLGIGGCWNYGVHHEKCGKFAVQLDSDDLYSDKSTLQQIIDAFYEQRCAMVVGSYMMTNFDLEMIAPGVIDHKEWTPDNGRNNALRINGLGAPRAFYTPLLREIKVPNTSYGEDYALGLNFSRSYQIGRIYEVLYLCRRWEDNSDAALDIVKMNRHNSYKDRIRTWELKARIALNSR